MGFVVRIHRTSQQLREPLQSFLTFATVDYIIIEYRGPILFPLIDSHGTRPELADRVCVKTETRRDVK